MNAFRPIILAGGSGTRLWPMSRSGYPKQFINLVDEGESLFQQTVKRCVSWFGSSMSAQPPIIVCNESNRFMVAEQLRAIGVKPQAIILEPEGKNTAPAVSLAACYMLANKLHEPMLILPSDHLLKGEEVFAQAVEKACQLSAGGRVVTFGIKPKGPETGYGYIKCGAALEMGYAVEKFVEKPDLDTATRYVASKDYFWNSGMFVSLPDVYQAQLNEHAHDIFTVVQAAYELAIQDLDFIRIHKERFSECRSESIDYAIMEQTSVAALVTLDGYWSDVGAWSAVADAMEQDSESNALFGDVLSVDTEDCLIRSESRLVATVGVSGLVVVETPDAVLVADKSSSQQVKTIVNQLMASQRREVESHTRVYRPWGWYETICLSGRFQVKRIMVKPGERLSLQMHHHRAEHWVVVKGTANIIRGDDSIMLTEDQSTYIPLGTQHRLENPGVIPLELIEIQTGSYLGEDDIVRFDDIYGRAPDQGVQA